MNEFGTKRKLNELNQYKEKFQIWNVTVNYEYDRTAWNRMDCNMKICYETW